MNDKRSAKRASRDSMLRRWKDVVGEEVASHTTLVDLNAGELLVEVDSAPLLNELSTYFRKEILESLQCVEEFRGVRKLRFRAGAR